MPPVQSDFVRNLVGVGGVMSLTLTFLHPVMWAPVAGCVGLGALATLVLAGDDARAEPPAMHFALVWIAATLVLALVNGAVNDFYNASQIAFMLFGLVLGYVISTVRTPAWAAWLPFIMFATLFLGWIAIGRDPGELLTRTSRNFVSVMMLGLYASAIVMSKPMRVERLHIVMALITLVVAIAGTGRGGIVAALVLNAGLIGNVLLRGRMTFVRSLGTFVVVVVGAVGVYVLAGVLLDQGALGRLASRGLQDAPRLAMILAYFDGITSWELFLGRDYYDHPFLARWDYNLHNSFLSAWAHLGLFYLLFVVGVLVVAAKRLRTNPVIAVAIGAFALRALTDTQMLAAKYDYVFFAVLFILLREPSPWRALHTSARSPLRTASDAPGT